MFSENLSLISERQLPEDNEFDAESVFAGLKKEMVRKMSNKKNSSNKIIGNPDRQSGNVLKKIGIPSREDSCLSLHSYKSPLYYINELGHERRTKRNFSICYDFRRRNSLLKFVQLGSF